MKATIVRTATVSDESPIIDVLMKAFSSDPAVRYLWPDQQQYLTHFPAFAKAFGGRAFTHGSAHYIVGYKGTALWLPPNVHPDMETLESLLQRTVSEKIQEDVFAIFEQMDRYHPSEPHWYLPLMGIDPSQQSKGLGSALIQHALVQCDHDSKLAYLESSNSRNIPFYERHGFELLGTIQVGRSPPIFPMLRKPR